MTKSIYTADFGTNGTVTREYFKPLPFAIRIEYTVAASKQSAVKIQFCQTKANAEKAAKMPKRYTVDSFVIVETTAELLPPKPAAPKKAKVVKPFTAGEAVQVHHMFKPKAGTVAKVGRLYAYITIAGCNKPLKYAFSDVIKTALAETPRILEDALAA